MSIEELQKSFAAPDPDFGPVPFWWWSAEEVTAERVRWQMQKFRAGGLRNIGIINIAPTGPQYGSVSDSPAYFSEQWWSMFEVALQEAERLGMNIYFYDQIGFSGSNFPARIVAEHPEYTGYLLRRFSLDEELSDDSTLLLKTDTHQYASVRQGFNWLDPAAAAMVLDRVHGEFERRFPHALGKTIAGSFQDELPPLPLWTAEMPELYKEKFGEDLISVLPAMFDDLPNSGQVRRQVYEIAAELAEKSFFIPISQWHGKHGMLLCCDQAGPARKVDVHGAQRLYLDYIRTHRWYNAPGCDMDGEIKPHSSMVHLHGGKRVFLEAFHTSGWGGTLEETMHWLIPWLQAGVTVYSPHSVYFSTRGGWWEWAPPDTGWRQPYFEHYSIFADTVSRVCSLLTEGTHVADIAVHYPSHAVNGLMSLDDGKSSDHPMLVANKMPNDHIQHIHNVYHSITGHNGRRNQEILGALREARIDFDITDDSALEKGVVKNNKLKIADEQFSVLLLCGTTIMDDAARHSIEQWIRNGGWVIGVDVPEGNPDFDGVHYVNTAEDAVKLIEERIPKYIEGEGLSLHRRTDDSDIFLVLPNQGELLAMHEPANPATTLQERGIYRLRTSGKPQLWDPVSGEIHSLDYQREGEWVEIDVPFITWPAALIVCPQDPNSLKQINGKGDSADKSSGLFPAKSSAIPSCSVGSELPSDEWRVLVVPTLDNRYGDFDLHGERTHFVPIEQRSVQVQQETGIETGERNGWHLPQYDDSAWSSKLWSEAAYWQASEGKQFDLEHSWPVVYSNTLGDHKFRSWAGRMGRIPRRFLNLGVAEKDGFVSAKTYVIAPSSGRYWVRSESNANVIGWVNGKEINWQGGPEEQSAWLELDEGQNEFVLQAQAIVSGLIRVGIEVNAEARPSLPKWIFTNTPNVNSQLLKIIHHTSEVPVQRVRMVFAAKGRVVLYINGTKVTEHGDFNPYIRQGQEEVDVTSLWKEGDNEVRFDLPEGAGEVLADAIVELFDGDELIFCTGEDWQDEQGNAPSILHEAVLQFAETETLWLSERPHPLPNVGWLMPNSVPESKPLPFHYDPTCIGKPIWLRFPLPVGAANMELSAHGASRVWINGIETAVRNGKVSFAPQAAGTIAAVRVEPSGPYTDADVLRAPIRFSTTHMRGSLGDWRTALCLPHHSGAVEYETTLNLKGTEQTILELGHIRGTAEVWLDGKAMGVRTWRPYRFDLGNHIQEGMHRLRIRITNTLGTHYEIGRPSYNVGGNADTKVSYWLKDEMNPEWKDDFASGGLYGPVRIYEY
jgi:hypothetical protein